MTTNQDIAAARRRLTNPDHRKAIELIADAVGTILSDGVKTSISLPPGISAEVVGQSAFACGAGPLLGFWIETGQLSTAPDVAGILAIHLEHSRRRATLLESDLSELLDRIDCDRIAPVLLKGFHTSREYFPEPACKPATDVDVLVSSSDVGEVQETLTKMGYQNQMASDSQFRSAWFRGGAPGTVQSLDFTHADNPRSIDLHVSLRRLIGPTTTLSFPDDPDRISEPWPGFDPRVRKLRQPHLTAFLAIHASASLRETQLIRLVELTRVIRSDARDALSWREFDEFVREFGLGDHVFKSLALVEKLSPGTVDPDTLDSLRVGASDRVKRVIDSVTPGDVQGGHPRSLDEALMNADGGDGMIPALLRATFPRGRLRSLPTLFWRRIGILATGRFSLRPRRPPGP